MTSSNATASTPSKPPAAPTSSPCRRTNRLSEQAQEMINSDDLFFANLDERPALITDVQLLAARQTSLPGSFITENGLLRHGWEAARVGWLSNRPNPSAPKRSSPPAISPPMPAYSSKLADPNPIHHRAMGRDGLGMLLALGILAMTVGLIRSQATADLRTLTATGASSSIRRTLSAATAGGMALLGAILGMLGAYAALAAGYFSDPPHCSRSPSPTSSPSRSGSPPSPPSPAGSSPAESPPPSHAKRSNDQHNRTPSAASRQVQHHRRRLLVRSSGLLGIPNRNRRPSQLCASPR